MSPRASTTAKRAQPARANRITADPPGTHTMDRHSGVLGDLAGDTQGNAG